MITIILFHTTLPDTVGVGRFLGDSHEKITWFHFGRTDVALGHIYCCTNSGNG